MQPTIGENVIICCDLLWDLLLNKTSVWGQWAQLNLFIHSKIGVSSLDISLNAQTLKKNLEKSLMWTWHTNPSAALLVFLDMLGLCSIVNLQYVCGVVVACWHQRLISEQYCMAPKDGCGRPFSVVSITCGAELGKMTQEKERKWQVGMSKRRTHTRANTRGRAVSGSQQHCVTLGGEEWHHSLLTARLNQHFTSVTVNNHRAALTKSFSAETWHWTEQLHQESCKWWYSSSALNHWFADISFEICVENMER